MLFFEDHVTCSVIEWGKEISENMITTVWMEEFKDFSYWFH